MVLENGSEIIPKDDVPDDVHRPKHVAWLHKNEFSFPYNTVAVSVCLFVCLPVPTDHSILTTQRDVLRKYCCVSVALHKTTMPPAFKNDRCFFFLFYGD
jgi:hypothetical protein